MDCRQAASRAVLSAVVLCLAIAGATSIAAAKRVALVIGNGAYANAPTLPNPPNDAKAIAADLETLGFEVHLALDVTQDAGARRRSTSSPPRSRAPKPPSSSIPATACRSTAATFCCRSMSRRRASAPSATARSTSRKSCATWRRTPKSRSSCSTPAATIRSPRSLRIHAAGRARPRRRAASP